MFSVAIATLVSQSCVSGRQVTDWEQSFWYVSWNYISLVLLHMIIPLDPLEPALLHVMLEAGWSSQSVCGPSCFPCRESAHCFVAGVKGWRATANWLLGHGYWRKELWIWKYFCMQIFPLSLIMVIAIIDMKKSQVLKIFSRYWPKFDMDLICLLIFTFRMGTHPVLQFYKKLLFLNLYWHIWCWFLFNMFIYYMFGLIWNFHIDWYEVKIPALVIYFAASVLVLTSCCVHLCQAQWPREAGARLNIKTSSYQSTDSHVKDQMVSRLSYLLTWEISYLERWSLYWNGTQIFLVTTASGHVISSDRLLSSCYGHTYVN